jgi:hypothetical protein
MSHCLDLPRTRAVDFITGTYPPGSEILDVGAGRGASADCLPHFFNLDAIEIWAPYVEEFALKRKYRAVYIADAVHFNFGVRQYALAILGGVLQHLSVADARTVFQALADQGTDVLVQIPFRSEAKAAPDNPFEACHQPDLTHACFMERYRTFGFRPLHVDEDAGLYTTRAEEETATLPDLVPAPGMHLFILDEYGLLFSEPSGGSRATSPLGALVWCELEAGRSWTEILHGLVTCGIPLAEARDHLQGFIDAWLEWGALLRPGEVPAPVERFRKTIHISGLYPSFDPMYYAFRSRFYRIAGLVLEFRYASEELERWIHPSFAYCEVLGSAPADGSITVVRILRYYYVYTNHTVVWWKTRPGELMEMVRHAVQEQVGWRLDHIVRLRAAAVVKDDRLIIITGNGRGRSTLAAQMIARGCEYYTDDTVFVERGTGLVRPLPLAIGVKDGAVSLLERHFYGLRDLPKHLRANGDELRFLPPPPYALPREEVARRPAVVVYADHIPGMATTLTPVSRAESLHYLMAAGMAPQTPELADMAVLVEMMEGVDSYLLSGGDNEGLVEALLSVAVPKFPPMPTSA